MGRLRSNRIAEGCRTLVARLGWMRRNQRLDAAIRGLQVQLREELARSRRAVERAEALEGAAEHARQQSTHLLAVVAHELRSPLGSIRNANTILAGDHREESLRARSIIERQIGLMARMIDDLMDLSRANAGKLSLVLEPVRVQEIANRAAEACALALYRRRQRLLINGGAIDLVVNADPLRLLQILGNLLDNASKYSPDCNVIHLEIQALERDISLSVRDQGIGIQADALDRIFEPFVQELRAATFNRSGLGVGLAVVRDLVQAHGGTVAGMSDGIGRGACFVVTLPRYRQPLDEVVQCNGRSRDDLIPGFDVPARGNEK